jgi:hypothetical protein
MIVEKKYVFLILFTLAIVTGLKPCGASAAILYFTANDSSPPTSLYSIDTETPNAITLLGSIDGRLIPGLSPSPDYDILYAVDRNNGVLLTIDVSSGASGFPAAGSVQEIGPLYRDIRELAYDALNDTLYGFNFANNRLMTINQATGEAITPPEGNVGLRLRGMTFDQVTGTLYGITADVPGIDSELYTITTTAVATVVNDGEPDRNQISGIFALPTGPTSTMYAIGRDDAAFLFSIDHLFTAAEIELTGISLPGEIVARDLAAPFLRPTPIPTLSQWGMIVLSLLLGILGILALRTKTITKEVGA